MAQDFLKLFKVDVGYDAIDSDFPFMKELTASICMTFRIE